MRMDDALMQIAKAIKISRKCLGIVSNVKRRTRIFGCVFSVFLAFMRCMTEKDRNKPQKFLCACCSGFQ